MSRRYGEATGLTTAGCTGPCPAGRYSSEYGLTDQSQCVLCPAAYRGWQCEEPVLPRKGTFDSTSGAINEEAHAYVQGNQIPQGYSPITFASHYDLPLDNLAAPS